MLGAVPVLLVLALGWLGYRGVTAARELRAAQTQAGMLQATLRTSLVAGGSGPVQAAAMQLPSLAEQVSRLGKHTEAARRATEDPLWRVVSRVPYVGANFAAVGAISAAADTVARSGLPDLAASAVALRGVGSRSVRQGLPAGELRRLAGSLQRADAATSSAERAVAGSGSAHLLGPVARARARLLDQLGSAERRLRPAAAAAALAAPMLGDTGPRTYFVALVNPAEARGGGGLLGGFAVVRADRGRLHVERIGSDSELADLRRAPGGLPPELVSDYGPYGATTVWAQSNMSAHFPFTGRLWASMYAALTGTRIDGAVSIDPTAMAVLLGGAAPIDVGPGARVTAGNVVDFLQRGEYALSLTPAQRKDVLRSIARVAVSRITAQPLQATVTTLPALAAAASTGHLRLWSAAPAEQAVLGGYPVAGQVPAAPGPFLSTVVNNAASGKLDAYLSVQSWYAVRTCPLPRAGATRQVEVRVVLHNRAPARGLPGYVTVRGDRPGGKGTPAPRPGANRSLVSVLLTRGAQVTSAALNGRDLASAGPGGPSLTETLERGHPVESIFVPVDAGRSATVMLEVDEPASTAEPVLLPQPMAVPQVLHASSRCGQR